MFPGHVAVAGLAPAFPRFFDLFVQGFVPGLCPQGVALAHHVALKRVEDRLGNIAISLQVAGAGADHVTGHSVRVLRAVVVDPPAGIQAPITGGVVASGRLQCLAPHFALIGFLGRYHAYDLVNGSHADHLPSKNAT